MQWKNNTVRTALISCSILAFCLVTVGFSHAADQQEAKKTARIESVAPTGDGPATALAIKLSSPAAYTSYKTASPLRLVIDFSQVNPGDITAPIPVDKGNFKKISASRFDTDAGILTRLEIELVTDREVIIQESPANSGELKVSFVETPPAVVPAAEIPAEKPVVAAELPVEKPAVPVEKPAVPAETPAVPAEKTAAPPAPPAPVAEPVAAAGNDTSFRVLNAITLSGNRITLALDGAIGDFKTFRLNKPERYIVDLPNVKSGLPARLIPLNASGVASARIGIYPDKVRIVLDAVNGSFPEASAVRSDSAVIITLDAKVVNENPNTKLTATRAEKPAGDGVTTEQKAAEKGAVKAEPPAAAPLEAKPAAASSAKPAPATEAQAAPAKSAAVSSAKKSSGPSAVEMIDFQVIDGISRVSVKVSGDINTDQPVKTPGYVTLTVKNSRLAKHLQRSLETRSFVSPVLRVTPLTVKNKRGSDTKIRIATRIAAPFEFRQEGDMLYVDFKHPEGLAGNKLIIEETEQKGKLSPKKQAAGRDTEMSTDLTPVSDDSVKPSSSGHAYRGRKVTLEFADAEVRKIFQLLAEVSNKNFVLGDEVSGAISLKLVNVPWDQALDIILDTKGLDKREDGNIILIKGKGKFKSQFEEDLEIKRTQSKSIELVTETFNVNYADIGAITTQFDKLKTFDRGQISSDPRTNKVIVKDTPRALSEMRAILAQLDLPEKQVMIEARIVEASSAFSQQLGIAWGMKYRDGSASIARINSLDTSFGGIASSVATVGTAPGAAAGMSFGTLASNVNIDMKLSAAASNRLIKIVSTPKVLTLNHKQAEISQGRAITRTITTGDKVGQKDDKADLKLIVTPHINNNNTILMKIEATNDEFVAGTNDEKTTKKALTELLLRDGETTVIGGIYKDNEIDEEEGVPWLKDIPFLGNFFKSSSKVKSKSELLIFITPRIIGTI